MVELGALFAFFFLIILLRACWMHAPFRIPWLGTGSLFNGKPPLYLWIPIIIDGQNQASDCWETSKAVVVKISNIGRWQPLVIPEVCERYSAEVSTLVPIVATAVHIWERFLISTERPDWYSITIGCAVAIWIGKIVLRSIKLAIRWIRWTNMRSPLQDP